MSNFAELKLDWLKRHTKIETRPCPEIFRALLVGINPSELIKGFKALVSAHEPNLGGGEDTISLDGKTMKGTKRGELDPIHMISAWSENLGITLGALESQGKKNEIKTLPKLIDMLDVKDAIVTTDAMGCQKDIARKVLEKGGNYVLQLKGNQSGLLEEVKAFHHALERDGYGEVKTDCFEQVDKGHGRLEVRRYQQFQLAEWAEKIRKWDGANSIIRVERYRYSAKGDSTEVA